MKFYKLKPEVPGHFGDETVFIDEAARPPKLKSLHFVFDGWAENDLVTAILIYLVTPRLANALRDLQPSATGIKFDSVRISKSGEYVQFGDLLPKDLPKFEWLRVTGTAGKDDFGISENRLIVSERIMTLLKEFDITQCAVSDYE